ncbi:MAG: hypothetical protein ABI171_23965 [Collimonas sp.]|uniref:SWIM zinc finger family protein n=1 Tax=Collimonas sp. TaxID=1963772 RepID=UPI0032672E7A
MSRSYGGWAPYVPVAKRRAQAQRKLEALRKKGRLCLPVVIEGRAIAKTFWGKKWCDNLEAYSDYANRLPRGRTYARNGSVVDLQIAGGKISALVSGSEMYEVDISVNDLETKLWQSILAECAGKVASLVELLQGRLSSAVMEVVTRHGNGLFPVPKQIKFRCSCPDSASMCKHVAATLYGVGARLDSRPELLFLLRQVDPLELIRQAGSMSIADAPTTASQHQKLDTSDLSSLFGIELNESQLAPSSPSLTAKTRMVAPKHAGTAKRALDSRTSTAKSAAQAKLKPVKKKVATPRSKQSKTVTPADLIARGIPRHMQQSWLGSGVLLRTEERGVYRTTKQTEAHIENYTKVRRTTKVK